jgi:hypothetical protein
MSVRKNESNTFYPSEVSQDLNPYFWNRKTKARTQRYCTNMEHWCREKHSILLNTPKSQNFYGTELHQWARPCSLANLAALNPVSRKNGGKRELPSLNLFPIKINLNRLHLSYSSLRKLIFLGWLAFKESSLFLLSDTTFFGWRKFHSRSSHQNSKLSFRIGEQESLVLQISVSLQGIVEHLPEMLSF